MLSYNVYIVVLFLVFFVLGYVLALVLFKRRQTKLLRVEFRAMKRRLFSELYAAFEMPLSLIKGSLLDLTEGNVPEKSKGRIYRDLIKNTHRIKQTINQLEEFGQAESGLLKIKAELIDLNELLVFVASQYKDLASRRNISFVIEQAAEPIMVWADKDKMEKIIFHLLVTCFKNTPAEGLISLRMLDDSSQHTFDRKGAVYKELSSTNSKKYVGIVITYLGIGIKKEQLPLIFNHFKQVPSTGVEHQFGLDFGLAYVKELVFLHSGNISVGSSEEKGARFLVEIPVGDDHLSEEDKMKGLFRGSEQDAVLQPLLEKELVGLSLKAKGGKPFRILVVEHDDSLRNYLRARLSGIYEVDCATSAKEALAICERGLPDLILTRLMMPQMDGLEMAKVLKTNVATCHIPIILMTASSGDDLLMEKSNGVDISIPKPIDIDFLLGKIEDLILARKKIIDKFMRTTLYDDRGHDSYKQDKEFVKTLEGLVMDNIAEQDFDVQRICDQTKLGRTVLYQKVKVITGVTLGEFIMGVRLKRAVTIMLTKDFSVTELAHMVGIKSPSYFTKSFKKKFGKTPTEFIKEHKPLKQ